MPQLTGDQAEFLSIVREYEEANARMRELSTKLDAVMVRLDGGPMFKDPADGVVYRVTRPTGTYVEYRAVSYERTRRVGEKKGTLSMKEAEAAGFQMDKNGEG